MFGMHGFQLGDHLGFSTCCQTPASQFRNFGKGPGNTKPNTCNNQPNIVGKAEKHLPPVELATPTPCNIVKGGFAHAIRDSKFPGRTNPADGTILQSPGFPHLVDDNIYCTIRLDMIRPLRASILALYTVIGFPSDLDPHVMCSL